MFPVSIRAIGLALIFVACVPPAAGSDRDLPTHFVPVDTSRLMGSPYPYVLENAFENLRFDKIPLQVLTQPQTPDRLYVLCRDGEILELEPRPDVDQSRVFFDLTGKVLSSSEEHGLLGFAFHPRYQDNGEVYACYTRRPIYRGAALRHDIWIAILFLIGAIIGALVKVPRTLGYIVLVVTALAASAAFALLLLPDSRITIAEKGWIGLGVFLASLALLYLGDRMLGAQWSNMTKRVPGICSGLMVAGSVAFVWTMVVAQSTDLAQGSINFAYSTKLQSRILHKVIRQFPEEVMDDFVFLLPVTQAEIVISRFRVDEQTNTVDPATETVLLTIPFAGDTHYGGSIEFGADGYLYAGVGDGMYPAMAQNRNTLHGSVLRLDIDHRDPGMSYAIPADNPFAVGIAGVRPEIWAYGFRNVWRLAFDRQSGFLWAGDVGRSQFEEVNRITKGGNYGWNLYEGFNRIDTSDPAADPDDSQSKFVDPVAVYDHRQGRAVIGGRVYRGKEFPELVGSYLYGDYVSGMVWASELDTTNKRFSKTVKLASPKIPIAGFGEDQQGEPLICSLDGIIYRLRRIASDPATPQQPFPETLSETGLFTSLEDLTSTEGMIPYDVNVPTWADGAVVQRLMALPKAGQVEFSATEPWTFPVGTVFVTHVSMPAAEASQPPRRLVSRLWVHGPYGWDGYSYVWNDEQTEAFREEQPAARTLLTRTGGDVHEQHWDFLTIEQCSVCHSKSNGFVLGVKTRQMNLVRDRDGESINQIALLDRLGIFDQPLSITPDRLPSYQSWDAGTADTGELARAYLAVNCAVCHVRGRLGLTTIDLRYDTAEEDMGLIHARPRRPKSARSAARHALVQPGAPDDSEMIRRMLVQNEDRMPPLGTSVPDSKAIKIIEAWIRGMSNRGRQGSGTDADSNPAKRQLAMETASYNLDFVRALAAEVRSTGDVAEGQNLFLSKKANCSACHVIQAVTAPADEFPKGPELSKIGTELSVEAIIESLVWPEREIKKGFELQTILLDDGRALSGYVEAEDDRSLTIRDLLTRKRQRVQRDSIERYGDPSTAMPSDVIGLFTRSQLRDLVAYLASLRTSN